MFDPLFGVLPTCSFLIIVLKKGELVALLELYSCYRSCGLWSVIVKFSGHTHFVCVLNAA